MDANNPLPQRVVRADIGKRAKPALVYTAEPHVIARFFAALKAWDQNYSIEVESIEHPDDPVPSRPLWRLWAWMN